MGFEGRSPREDTFENKYHYPRNPQNNTPSFTLQVRAQNALLLYDVGGCLQAQEHHTIKKSEVENLASDLKGGRWDSNPRP